MKVYGVTQGKRDFLWLGGTNEYAITSHDNRVEGNVLPPAPKMSKQGSHMGQRSPVVNLQARTIDNITAGAGEIGIGQNELDVSILKIKDE